MRHEILFSSKYTVAESQSDFEIMDCMYVDACLYFTLDECSGWLIMIACCAGMQPVLRMLGSRFEQKYISDHRHPGRTHFMIN
jgi:hypothetical protein